MFDGTPCVDKEYWGLDALDWKEVECGEGCVRWEYERMESGKAGGAVYRAQG